jgi:membrane protease subunit (stomatin/prohibitin family)
VLTYLKNWDKLFESPFKSDVYFFSTRTQLDQKWGTPNPITIRDKDFGIVRMRAFGIYSYHLTDPKPSTRRFPAPAASIPAMNWKASCATRWLPA